jgi:Pilin (bacterial filament)/zinc-ribbon domain
MTTCTRCGKEAAAADKFCHACGAPLTSRGGSRSEENATIGGRPDDTGKLMRVARRAHHHRRWDEARDAYQRVIEASAHASLTDRAERGLAMVDKGQRLPGRLGLWSLAFLAAPWAVMTLTTLLPDAIGVALGLSTMSLISLGGLVGGILALIALLRQPGAWNKLAGLATLGLIGSALFVAGGMDQVKEQRFLVTQGIAAALPARVAVTEYHAKNGRFPNSAAEAPFAPLLPEQAKFLDAIRIGPDGMVTIHFAAGYGGPFAGKTIVWRPTTGSDGVTWDCREGTVPHHVRPPPCRQPGDS